VYEYNHRSRTQNFKKVTVTYLLIGFGGEEKNLIARWLFQKIIAVFHVLEFDHDVPRPHGVDLTMVE
jgi:hypothetical protein